MIRLTCVRGLRAWKSVERQVLPLQGVFVTSGGLMGGMESAATAGTEGVCAGKTDGIGCVDVSFCCPAADKLILGAAPDRVHSFLYCTRVDSKSLRLCQL